MLLSSNLTTLMSNVISGAMENFILSVQHTVSESRTFPPSHYPDHFDVLCDLLDQ